MTIFNQLCVIAMWEVPAPLAASLQAAICRQKSAIWRKKSGNPRQWMSRELQARTNTHLIIVKFKQ